MPAMTLPPQDDAAERQIAEQVAILFASEFDTKEVADWARALYFSATEAAALKCEAAEWLHPTYRREIAAAIRGGKL